MAKQSSKPATPPAAPNVGSAAPKPAANETTLPGATGPNTDDYKILPSAEDKAQLQKADAAAKEGTGEPDGQIINLNTPAPAKPQAIEVTPSYLAAAGDYFGYFKKMPDAGMTEQEIWDAVHNEDDRLTAEANKAAQAEKQKLEELQIEQSRQAEEFDYKNFLIAKRGAGEMAETKRFSRVTWKLMSGNKDGWKEQHQTPPEVQALKK